MEEPKNFRMPMPAKMGERGSTGGVGHTRASITRQGMHAQNGPMLKTGGMTLQPGPTMPSEANGFAPDEVISEHEADAQSAQTKQPEIDLDIAAPPVVPTTEEPSEVGESDPVPGDADPGATGAAESPGYAGMTEQSHPRGYPGN